jgi:hypothetical protein
MKKSFEESSWNVMAHGDAQEKRRGNEKWVTSKRHMTAEHRLARAVQTLQADVHSSPASSRMNWCRRFKWTRPFCHETKSGFCGCAITFQMQFTKISKQIQCQGYEYFHCTYCIAIMLNRTHKTVSHLQFTRHNSNTLPHILLKDLQNLRSKMAVLTVL